MNGRRSPPAGPPTGRHAHTGYWLNRLRGLVHGRFEAAPDAQGGSIAQWSVPITLFRGDAETPAGLARFLDADAGAPARMIDRLEARQLVRRVRGAGDRRSVSMELTEAGRAMAPGLAATADANHATFFGILPPEDRATFRHLLGRLPESHGVAAPEAWRIAPPCRARHPGSACC